MIENSPEVAIAGQIQPDWVRMHSVFRDYVIDSLDDIDSDLTPVKKQRLHDLFDVSVDNAPALEKIARSLQGLTGEAQLDLTMYVCGYTSEMTDGLEAVAAYKRWKTKTPAPEEPATSDDLGPGVIELRMLTDDDPDFRELPWEYKILCEGQNGDLFFEDSTKQLAKKICGLCVVRKECLESALELKNVDDQYGIRGGVGPTTRQRLRKQRGIK